MSDYPRDTKDELEDARKRVHSDRSDRQAVKEFKRLQVAVDRQRTRERLRREAEAEGEA